MTKFSSANEIYFYLVEMTDLEIYRLEKIEDKKSYLEDQLSKAHTEEFWEHWFSCVDDNGLQSDDWEYRRGVSASYRQFLEDKIKKILSGFADTGLEASKNMEFSDTPAKKNPSSMKLLHDLIICIIEGEGNSQFSTVWNTIISELRKERPSSRKYDKKQILDGWVPGKYKKTFQWCPNPEKPKQLRPCSKEHFRKTVLRDVRKKLSAADKLTVSG
jgi:hypothetical protein